MDILYGWPLKRDSNLGELDFQVVQDGVAQKNSKRKTTYLKYSGEDYFKICKYAKYEEVSKKTKQQSKTITKNFLEKKEDVH